MLRELIKYKKRFLNSRLKSKENQTLPESNSSSNRIQDILLTLSR